MYRLHMLGNSTAQGQSVCMHMSFSTEGRSVSLELLVCQVRFIPVWRWRAANCVCWQSVTHPVSDSDLLRTCKLRLLKKLLNMNSLSNYYFVNIGIKKKLNIIGNRSIQNLLAYKFKAASFLNFILLLAYWLKFDIFICLNFNISYDVNQDYTVRGLQLVYDSLCAYMYSRRFAHYHV